MIKKQYVEYINFSKFKNLKMKLSKKANKRAKQIAKKEARLVSGSGNVPKAKVKVEKEKEKQKKKVKINKVQEEPVSIE